MENRDCSCGITAADFGDLDEHVVSKLETGDLNHGLKSGGEEPNRWRVVRERIAKRQDTLDKLAEATGISVKDLRDALNTKAST